MSKIVNSTRQILFDDDYSAPAISPTSALEQKTQSIDERLTDIEKYKEVLELLHLFSVSLRHYLHKFCTDTTKVYFNPAASVYLNTFITEYDSTYTLNREHRASIKFAMEELFPGIPWIASNGDFSARGMGLVKENKKGLPNMGAPRKFSRVGSN